MENGITLAPTHIVKKKTITYREITIAIGVIVAMVIALTLWTRVPEEKLSRSNTDSPASLSSPAGYLFDTAVKMFSDEANAALDRP
ncbi:MAG: hypothetical protein WEB30_01870 [Cyclobacteriaceae bacterium]